MKKSKSKIAVFATVILLFSAIGCKKDYLDVNTDPNLPSEISINLALPSAQLAIGSVMGNNFHSIGGIYGQFFTQSPAASQFKTFEQYNPGAEKFDWPWRILYADCLEDCKYIVSSGTEQGLSQYVACAKIMQAYAFQILTDNFGDVPYTEANLGNSGIISPHYDSQQDVYNGIIAKIEEGIALIDENNTGHPLEDDLFFQGDMGMWRKFANTLKLRVDLRLAYVDAGKAQAGIEALSTSGAQFLTAGESVRIDYTTTAGNTHPYFSFVVGVGGTQNLVASNTAIDNFIANNDTNRLAVLYAPSPAGVIQGIPQGAYNLPASTPVSFPGTLTGANTDDPNTAAADVILVSDYESYFLQSEAAARGWLTSTGTAEDLYKDGIQASFDALGFTDHSDPAVYDGSGNLLYLSEPAVVFPAGGSLEDKIKAIITQKWYAICGTQGDEAWIEWRRTNYPDFFVQSANNIMGASVWPYRLFYPSTEVTRNINFPGQKTIDTKVWWDVN